MPQAWWVGLRVVDKRRKASAPTVPEAARVPARYDSTTPTKGSSRKAWATSMP